MSDPSPPELRHRPGSGIVLAPYDARWPVAFQDEASTIRSALSDLPITLHHIGSTAIPGIVAKPVIDMLGVVSAIRDLDARERQLTALGYEALGEFGIPGRRYFRKNESDGVRTHQLHVFAVDSPEIDRHLDFRDFLRASPADATAYAALKQDLALRSASAGEYSDGKTEFIRTMERRAATWREELVRGSVKPQLPPRTRALRAILFWLIVVSIPVLMLWLSSPGT